MNELKNKIQTLLIDKKTGSIHKNIHIPKLRRMYNLEGLFEEIIQATLFLSSDPLYRLDERIYCILHDIQQRPKCGCGNEVKFKRFLLGYASFCSVKCRANDVQWQTTVANTNQLKYGVTHIAQLPNERTKRSINLKERHHLIDFSQAQQKRNETVKRLYGETNTGWLSQAIETRINNGNMVPVELLDEYREYYKKVVRITEKQDLSSLPNIEKRGVLGKDDDAHHVDHIVSIYDGFMNDVPCEIIGNIVNLRCIPALENINKGNDSSISIEELLTRYENNVRI